MADSLPSGVRAWIAGARVRTLPAAVVPVLVGTAAARGVEGPLIAWRAVAAGVVAIALQVATNFANDYSDGIRGTDDPGARVGPVRLVGWGIKPPSAVKKAALACFALAGVVGLSLAVAVGPELLAVGAISIAAGWFYTGGSKPYGYLGLGEVFVFVFFGVVATVGSTYVQLGEITGLSLLASVPVGLLATALLVTNNLRDIPGDRVVGKQTLAVRLGDARTRTVYTGMLAVAFLLVVPIALDRPFALVAVAAVVLGVPPVRAVRSGAAGPALIPVLAATGKVQMAFGALLSVGLALSA
ncbi:1,4-dihydroxy-2-naphthoate polyprenyltransferase [Actinospongicola halichondriae]|uniref:1,4-dihydroxy-2-naphthoate polyprenyltransferase n=1 Tax=Actinospongicola halichondriae TaxID=3236844 RepID=UPI003D52A1B7